MERADALSFGTIVVVGGGCYGAYYLRQLRRAREHGALRWTRVLMVDRDPACAVASDMRAGNGPDVELRVAEWDVFFEEWLATEAAVGDAIVPSPLMPHLFLHWLEQRAKRRWPERTVRRSSPAEQQGIPWQRTGADGTRYLSFAEWTCPVNCVEPRTCPHTRGARDWSMPVTLQRAGAGTAIFHCVHRAFGVGMIDAREILRAGELLDGLGDRGDSVRLRVGTVSHCHGALGELVVERATAGTKPGTNQRN